MAAPRNLVPDSTLAQDAVDLLRLRGGRAPAEQLAEEVLELSGLDAATAALLVAELIKDDWRMRLADGGAVELTCADDEACALAETEFVVVDVETTDARTPPGRVVEIGAYRVHSGCVRAEFQTLVNPETPIPSFIVGLTGINDEMVRRAPRFAEIAPAWLEFVGTSVIVAHNAAFDVRFLNYELGQVYPNRRMGNAHLCTVKLARGLLPDLANHRLHTIAEHFAVPIPRRHRAPDDAHATAQILVRLLAQLDRAGVRDLAAARRYRAEVRGQRSEVS
ncbi:MAG TPA: exonuclease domain-containing protein [Pyrinomonadaceae bacterium]|jgi:DNA polymerase III epsilon subunit family exonuclease